MSKLVKHSFINASSKTPRNLPIGDFVFFDDLEPQLLAIRGLAYQSMTSKTMAKKNAKAIHEAVSIMLGLE